MSSYPRRWLNFSTVPQGRFFFQNHPAKFFLRGTWGKPLLRGIQRECWVGCCSNERGFSVEFCLKFIWLTSFGWKRINETNQWNESMKRINCSVVIQTWSWYSKPTASARRLVQETQTPSSTTKCKWLVAESWDYFEKLPFHGQYQAYHNSHGLYD